MSGAPAPAPLSHHQILALVAPFSAAGLAVDLQATDRQARRLHFKPVPVALEGPDGSSATLQSQLLLHCPPPAQAGSPYRLVRRLQHPAGLVATLEASGTDTARLLAQVQAVPAARQFDHGPGWLAARSYTVAGSSTQAPGLRFAQGQAQLDGARLGLQVMDVKHVAGDLSVQPMPGERLELPEDVLAVMGWNWVRLVPAAEGYTSKLRLRGQGDLRTRRAEAALAQAAGHLAQVLAATPAAYAARHRWARWGVALRRSIPTLTALGLIGGALALPHVADRELSGVWMALHYLPIAVLAVSFTVQELSRFEIPRPPARLRMPRWRQPLVPGGSAAAPGAGAQGLPAAGAEGAAAVSPVRPA